MFTDNQIISRLVVTVILSGFIGFERQLHKRTAGLRTHILVALGSCLIMLTSLYVFDIYKDITKADPARIAAGVITGVIPYDPYYDHNPSNEPMTRAGFRFK